MDGSEFISMGEGTHVRFETTLAGSREAWVLLSGTCGRWPVEEGIAHAVWYGRVRVDVFRQRDLIRKVFPG
jgi:hypothetical protein